jgi:hypothetical protein
MEGLVVIFRSHKGPASKTIWQKRIYLIPIHLAQYFKIYGEQKSFCFNVIYSVFRPLHSATMVACQTAPVASSLQYHSISPPPQTPFGLCHPHKRLVAGDGFHAVIATNACT